ncbi:acyltransferase family protein [Pseudotabrizicola alkalilacus]|nr:acyltransferase family protein [Pseudotabrizicola alkalilacus]
MPDRPLKYRPEIDGLRALAVVPVVFFHANHEWVPGGFVGVDVFFVISGYLITRIIHDDLSVGKFSIWTFYARRMRRIAPVLVAVMIATMIAGSVLLIPPLFQNLQKAVTATAFFVSNIYFWSTVDYFAAAADLNPLLHTWSLAVEEQFYIFFPLMMILFARRGGNLLVWSIIAIFVLSLALSVGSSLSGRLSEANFYLLPTRAWELAAGSLLALARPKAVSLRGGGILAFGGMALIVLSLFLINRDMPFPGYFAIPPVLGAALIIRYADKGNLAGRILSLPPFVWTGLLSYSIYMWHQPVLAFSRQAFMLDTGGIVIVPLLIFILVLSYFSWRWIETPFRRGKRNWSSRKVVTVSVVSLAALSISVMFTSNDAIFRMRYPEDIRRIYSFLDYRETDDYRTQFRNGCFVSGQGTDGNFPYDACIVFREGLRNYLIIGDSHAAMLAVALSETAPDVNLIQATASGCLPVLGALGRETCIRMRDSVLDALIGDERLEGVIFAARWNAGAFKALEATVALAVENGHAVSVVGPAPEYAMDFPIVFGHAAAAGALEQTMRFAVRERQELDARMRLGLSPSSAHYFSLIDIICDSGTCQRTASDGDPMQFDYGHLTLSGAREVAGHLVTDGIFSE